MTSPIEENTFAAACYDQNSILELVDALFSTAPDRNDINHWKINAQEWRVGVRLALLAKLEKAGVL